MTLGNDVKNYWNCGGGRNFPVPFKVLSADLIIKLMLDRLTRENIPV